MKKLFLTLGLAAITAIGFGQNSDFESPFIFTQTKTEINGGSLTYLQTGSRCLVKSHNSKLVSVGLILLGTGIFAAEGSYDNYTSVFFSPSRVSSGLGPPRTLSTLTFITASAFGVNAIIQERLGIERLYLGMNGVTIKPN